jgi:molybdate transport system substrate-binding protein
LSTNRRLVLGALTLLLPLPAAAQGQTVTVFAAASLTDSLKRVADAYKARTGAAVTLSFGASSTLARQIEQGAGADIFFSADTDWMDYLEKAGQIATGTRKDLLGNRLVLVAASDAKPAPRIAAGFDLAGALGNGRLAMADPAKAAQAENVRVALEYVARGEAPFGIVYATDAKIAPVKVVGTFPENSHPPIVYPVALTKSAAPGARGFLIFLEGPKARAIFAKAGFTPR